MSAYTLEIGMADRGLQDLGDIIQIRRSKQILDVVDEGDNLLMIDWDGHRITTADELYHTIWETISGTYMLHTPVNGRIEYIFEGNDILNEDEILATLSIDESSLLKITASLVSEKEYLKSVENRGAFNELEGLYR